LFADFEYNRNETKIVEVAIFRPGKKKASKLGGAYDFLFLFIFAHILAVVIFCIVAYV